MTEIEKLQEQLAYLERKLASQSEPHARKKRQAKKIKRENKRSTKKRPLMLIQHCTRLDVGIPHRGR